MKVKFILSIIVVLWVVNLCPLANAFIMINEILADPPLGLWGDANGDGVGSVTQDEFIELLNLSNQTVNLSGWSIADNVKTRHIFGANSFISPNAYMVVFGGGTPMLNNINWQTASTGTLGLNNSGDSVYLYNLNLELMDQVNFGVEGNADQSLVRFPEGSGEFIFHSNAIQTQGVIFSPGTTVNGELVYMNPNNQTSNYEAPASPANAVPEPLSVSLLAFGLAGVFFQRKNLQSTVL